MRSPSEAGPAQVREALAAAFWLDDFGPLCPTTWEKAVAQAAEREPDSAAAAQVARFRARADQALAGPLAGIAEALARETERADAAQTEVDAVDRAFEGLEETDRARRIGQWIATAAAERTACQAAEAEVARLTDEIAALRAALEPFAKTAELFGPRDPEDYDQCIYRPAAGRDYELSGDHLRAARAALAHQEGRSDGR